jgi:hypothetical protein
VTLVTLVLNFSEKPWLSAASSARTPFPALPRTLTELEHPSLFEEQYSTCRPCNAKSVGVLLVKVAMSIVWQCRFPQIPVLIQPARVEVGCEITSAARPYNPDLSQVQSSFLLMTRKFEPSLSFQYGSASTSRMARDLSRLP